MEENVNIGTDLKDFINEDCQKGMAESHLSGWFSSRYKGGKSKGDIEFDLNVNHDDSLEIERTEDELKRKLNDDEITFLIEVFHKAIIDNIEFVRDVAVGYYDTLDEFNVN